MLLILKQHTQLIRAFKVLAVAALTVSRAQYSRLEAFAVLLETSRFLAVTAFSVLFVSGLLS